MKNTLFKYLGGLVVAVVLALVAPSLLRAEGLRHLVWQNPGTNLTTIAGTDASSSPIVVGSTASGHNRLWAEIINTNAAATAAIAVKVSGVFSTTATADVTVPAGSEHTFNFGEGYNGPLSIRSTNGVTLNFIYWEGGY